MPLRKLTAKELAHRKATTAVSRQYVDILSGLKAGDGGTATTADEKVTKQTIKNRINRAADSLGITVSYVRSGKEEVVFEIVETK